MSDLTTEQVAAALAAMPISIRGTRASQYRQAQLAAARYEHKGFHRQAEIARAAAAEALTPPSSKITKRCDGCGKITTAMVPLTREMAVVLCAGCKDEADAFADAIRCRSTMD